MKKIICFFVTVLVLLTCISIPSLAAATNKPIITVYKYDDVSGKYDIVNPANVRNGDLLCVKVSFESAVESLASLRLKLEYSKDTASYITGSFSPEIVSGNPNAGDPVYTDKEGCFTVLFANGSASGDVEIAQNVTSVATFIFTCTGNSGEISFKATMDNLLDKNYVKIGLSANTAEIKTGIAEWVMNPEYLEVFKKLENIVYSPENEETDSKKDIELADKIYNGYRKFDDGVITVVYPGLTAAEKQSFKSTYPEIFKAYENAWTTYYNKALEASEELINAEVARFKSDNKNALDIASPEDVNTDNYQAVLDAISEYKKLSNKAKMKLNAEYRHLLSLNEAAEKIVEMLEADLLAKTSFIDEFQEKLWKHDTSDVNNENYGQYMTIVASAKSAYGGIEISLLSDAVKSKVKELKAHLDKMEARVSELAKANGESADIQKEINEFTSKWYKTITLNSVTVGVKDQTALEMMLEDFEKLSKTAQDRMSNTKNSANALLELIKELSAIKPDLGTPEQVVVEKTKVVKETVEKEVKVDVPVEVEKVVKKTYVSNRNVPKIVYIVVILMGVAVLSVFASAMIFVYKKKSLKGMETDDNENI